MSRLQQVFAHLAEAGRTALIPFMTAGFPEPEATLPLMQALVRNGADILELGVPFSDPMADGAVIQRASERALKQGMTLRRVLSTVRRFREQDPRTPVVLMGYANPIEAIGRETFVTEAAAAGVDGLLIVDYPPEEYDDFADALKTAGIDPIFLLAPTSAEARFEQLARIGQGYLYYVSLTGVTGAGHLDLAAVERRVPQIRARVGLPVAVGFGIRDAASARRIAGVADGVVIGTRLIEIIEAAPRETALDRAGQFIREIRLALDEPVTAGERT